MLKVYLAGEIHTNWREEIIENCKKENLDIKFSSPVTDHPSSDNCGVEILGLRRKISGKIEKVQISIQFELKNQLKIVMSLLLNLVKNTNNGMQPLMQVMQQR
jgi:YtoQ family protein